MSTRDHIPAVPALVPQPHGGALHTGGTPGNRGGGRKPARIRRRALRMLDDNLPVLDHIAKGVTVAFVKNGAQVLVTPKPAERVAAIRVLHEIGRRESVPVAEVKARMRSQINVIRTRDTWRTDELLHALDQCWH